MTPEFSSPKFNQGDPPIISCDQVCSDAAIPCPIGVLDRVILLEFIETDYMFHSQVTKFWKSMERILVKSSMRKPLLLLSHAVLKSLSSSSVIEPSKAHAWKKKLSLVLPYAAMLPYKCSVTCLSSHTLFNLNSQFITANTCFDFFGFSFFVFFCGLLWGRYVS